MVDNKKQYTKKEHYIPQYSIRPFEIEKGKCLVANLEHTPATISMKPTNEIMQEIDLYEVKNEFGEYINRNEIEEDYKFFEDNISIKFKKFVEMMEANNYQEHYKRMIKGKSNEWAHKEAALLNHLIITLIRSPKIKSLAEQSKFPKFMKPIIYRQMTTSTIKAVELAKSLLAGDELELALLFLKNMLDENQKSGLQTIAEHLFGKYQIRIYRAIGKSRLFLSDEPITIQKFETVDYVLPVSPRVCIGARPLASDGKIWKIDGQVFEITDEEVDNLNHYTIMNAEKNIIVQKQDDLNFIKRELVEKES
jgi:hypothetical protein